MPEFDLMSIYRETVHPLYRYVSRRTGGQRELAEDIVQETFIRAFEHWRKTTVRNHLAWLKTVAHNLLVSHYRRIQPHSLDEIGLDPVTKKPDLDTPNTVTWVQWGLTRLKRKQARILEMFYFDEKTVANISTELKISERAVEGRLRRARAALRSQLERFQRAKGGH